MSGGTRCTEDDQKNSVRLDAKFCEFAQGMKCSTQAGDPGSSGENNKIGISCEFSSEQVAIFDIDRPGFRFALEVGIGVGHDKLERAMDRCQCSQGRAAAESRPIAMSTQTGEDVVSVSRAKPKEISDLVVGWIRSAMEVNKFLESGDNIA
jgi:hypothetical protein